MALDTTQKKKVIQEFAVSASDTGSTNVQIALLTEQITQLQDHCTKNPKDFSCKRGLLQAVANRRGLLAYLQKNDEKQYRTILEQLGLRK